MSTNSKFSKEDLLQKLLEQGIRQSSPLFSQAKSTIESFGDIISERNIRDLRKSSATITHALDNELVIQDFKEFGESLSDAFDKAEPLTSGAVADYIPQLARVDPVSYTHLTLPTTPYV